MHENAHKDPDGRVHSRYRGAPCSKALFTLGTLYGQGRRVNCRTQGFLQVLPKETVVGKRGERPRGKNSFALRGLQKGEPCRVLQGCICAENCVSTFPVVLLPFSFQSCVSGTCRQQGKIPRLGRNVAQAVRPGVQFPLRGIVPDGSFLDREHGQLAQKSYKKPFWLLGKGAEFAWMGQYHTFCLWMITGC